MRQNWKKNTALFLVSQMISLFGSSLVQYAIMWYITLNTQSGVMMTISIICGFLPTFFLSPFAGVWADRFSRKKLIMLADAGIALATLGLAILFLLGYDQLWPLFMISAIRALGGAVQSPAVSALLPQIVPEEKLTQVNAAISSAQSVVMLLSPMLSGLLLTLTNIEFVFFIDVITALIAIVVLQLWVDIPLHIKAAQARSVSYYQDLREGLGYIRRHAFIKKFFLFCALFFLLASPVAFLTPLQVARSFGNEVWRLTAIEVAFSLGMILGGMTMAWWGGFKNKAYTMIFSSLLIGSSIIALGMARNFGLYLMIMVINGITIPVFNTPSTVLLQEKVEESYLGRVFGVLSMIASIMMPLGMLLFGPLSDLIKIELLLLGTGALMFLQGLFLFGSRTLIEAGK